MHFPPFPGTQFTLCLPLHSETAERYFFQCLLYPDGLISVNKDLDVVFITSREHFAEDKYKSAMKMSHRPAAGSLRFCGRETSSPPASSATVTLLPQATKHITCGQQPSNISARALLYAHCFLWGCSSMRSSASACACRGGSTLAWLMWRASRGGYDPFGFPLRHPRLCLPG